MIKISGLAKQPNLIGVITNLEKEIKELKRKVVQVSSAIDEPAGPVDSGPPLSSTSPTSVAPGVSASAGTSSSAARSDHTHNVSTSAPASGLTASTSNSEGTSSSLSRSDHSHAISTGSPSTDLSATTSNSQGSSSNLARSDHSHGISTGSPTSNLTASTTNSTGSASTLSRSDHSHAITTGTASTISGINTAGTSTSLARADHNHALGGGVVDLANLSTSAQGRLVPVGAVMPFAGSSAPVGWLICNGTAISRTTYADLFSAIGTAFGAPDGSTFRVPNLSGRIVQGVNPDFTGGQDGFSGSGSIAASNFLPITARGEWRGGTTHTLITAEIPAHTHTVSYAQASNTATSGTGNRSSLAGTGSTQTTSSTGDGAAHNNVPPVLIMNYIIKI